MPSLTTATANMTQTMNYNITDETHGLRQQRLSGDGGNIEPSTARVAQDVPFEIGGTGVDSTSRRRQNGRRHKTRAHLTIATLNMRGFGGNGSRQENGKWWSINQVIRDGKIGILALQETHLTSERVDALNETFGATMRVLACLDCENQTGARGVAFAVNKRLVDAESAKLKEVKPGRVALLTVPWTRGKTLRVMNVYAPNEMKENAALWRDLSNSPVCRGSGKPNVMLGDLNMVEDAMDRLPPRRDPSEAATALQQLRVKLDMVDGWRERNPTERAFTYMQVATGSQSRIDRIYLSRELMQQANDWNITGAGIRTDHRLTSVGLANNDAPYMGKGRWAVPQALLSDTPFLRMLQDRGLQLQSELDTQSERTALMNPQIAMASFKADVRDMAKKRAKQAIPKLIKRIEGLKSDIKQKLNSPDVLSDGTKNDVAILQGELVELELRSFGSKRLAVTVNDWAQGETVCKYWTRLNATPQPTTVIHELLENSVSGVRTATRRSDRMASIAKDHYDGLQRDPDLDSDKQERNMVEAIEHLKPRLSDHEKTAMAEEITDLEVARAIRDSANGKAPGMDGVPTEIWKILLHQHRTNAAKGKAAFDVARALQKVYNDVAKHGIVQGTGFADGWICPIYKLKKDTREIVNYRPITLLNTDYKLMTRILAMRVAVVAETLIHPDQAGFVPGRQIFDHIKLNKLIIDYAEAEEVNGMIVALDQEKAYDRIDHTYLWRVLRKFNFPESFIRVVQNLYAEANSTVIVNGVLSEWFKIVRGVRQGDPMSCLLFDLAIEPLATMLRDSPIRGLVVPGRVDRLIATLFADDTTTYLSADDNYEDLSAILTKWCEASRARFNNDKTEYIPIGTPTYRAEVVARTSTTRVSVSLPAEAKVVPDGVAIRSLGAWIGNKVDNETPWTPMIETIQKRLSKWAARRPTLYGRKLAVGMEVGGRTQFLAKAQTMPDGVVDRIKKAVKDFMWPGETRPMISKDTLHRAVKEGGLNLLDIEARNDAIDLMWLRAYLNLSPGRPTWAYIADVLISRAVAASAYSVEEDAKVNMFLQSWKVSTTQRGGLSEDLRRMLRVAEKYGVRVDAPNPALALRRAMPVWYHIGKAEGRSVANTKASRCLRENHRVTTVSDAVRVADRLPRRTGQAGVHRQNAACKCVACDEDRRLRGCDNPHRCAVAAQKLSQNLDPIWQDLPDENSDGLTLTNARLRKNAEAGRDGGRIEFNPTITNDGATSDIFRVFVDKSLEHRRVPARRPPRPFQLAGEAMEVYTDGSCDMNGCSNASAGSGVWFGKDDARNMALRVPGALQTNQTAEVYAVAAAAAIVAPFAPLHIVSDSKYVIEGLTRHLPAWERRGWLGVANAEGIQDVVARLRARSAVTTLRWVKGHTGDHGNEEADKLAKKGATRATPAALQPAQTQFLQRGASLAGLTQRLAYQGIRLAKDKGDRNATRNMIERIQAALMDATKRAPQEATIWKGIRDKSVPRRMRDFWWKATHDALRIGRYWEHIPGYEIRATCATCNCTETLEHILLECDAPGQREVWECTDSLLKDAQVPEIPRTLGVVLGVPALSLRSMQQTKTGAGKQRLLRILTMEATHLVWALRCERVIRHDGDQDKWLSRDEIHGRWRAAINRRLRIDQGLTAARLQKRAVDRGIVLATWSDVLVDRDRLPEDWIGKSGVLVGMPVTNSPDGVG